MSLPFTSLDAVTATGPGEARDLVRAHLTALSGGTSPTVTATIATKMTEED